MPWSCSRERSAAHSCRISAKMEVSGYLQVSAALPSGKPGVIWIESCMDSNPGWILWREESPFASEEFEPRFPIHPSYSIVTISPAFDVLLTKIISSALSPILRHSSFRRIFSRFLELGVVVSRETQFSHTAHRNATNCTQCTVKGSFMSQSPFLMALTKWFPSNYSESLIMKLAKVIAVGKLITNFITSSLSGDWK